MLVQIRWAGEINVECNHDYSDLFYLKLIFKYPVDIFYLKLPAEKSALGWAAE